MICKHNNCYREDINMTKIQEISNAVEKGKAKLIKELVQEALDTGENAADILNEMTEVMGVVGEKFQAKQIFVPEMLIAAKTMKQGVEVLQPHLKGTNTNKYGKFILGTVAGDLHDIGKNLVGLMVESAGFEVIDLGVDVPPEKFVEAIRENPDCKLVGLSALLTTTMGALRNTIEVLDAAGCRDQVKIMVGGAPVTQSFANDIGADAYALDAGAAAVKAKELVA